MKIFPSYNTERERERERIYPDRSVQLSSRTDRLITQPATRLETTL